MVRFHCISTITILLTFTAAMCRGQSTYSDRQAAPVEIVPGIDWRLPDHTRMSPRAGYLTWNPNWARKRADLERYRDGGLHLGSILMPVWADMNPSENQYDWRRLDQHIRFSTEKPGTGYILCVVGFSQTHPNWKPKRSQRNVVPAWVEAKGKVGYLSNGMVAAWEPGCVYQRYFGRFLKALGDRYKADPKLIAVSMAGLDCYHGEWCWRGTKTSWDAADVDRTLLEAETTTGFNPQSFERWGMEFIDGYVAAFKPFQHKLVWMNGEDQFIWTPRRPQAYADPSQALWQYAYAQGCGGRDGAVEVWNRFLNPGHGMRWTEAGYLEVNEDLSPLRENCAWYTENEYYRLEWPEEEIRLRWFTSSMRALQMRRQWVAVWDLLDDLERLDPAFVRWTELSLGKNAQTSADAWCWLREGYPKRNRPLKNFERWLFQRDIMPDGLTRPAHKVTLGPIAATNRYVFAYDYEYQARRTDMAAGSHCIYFRADRNFVDTSTKGWQLKVSYVDSPDVTWTIEYSTDSGSTDTGIIHHTGTGTLQTISLELPGIQFRGAINGMDFRIVCLGPQDLTTQFVRLVKK